MKRRILHIVRLGQRDSKTPHERPLDAMPRIRWY
jgi:hypothetical protein